jgi:hypothetical protein
LNKILQLVGIRAGLELDLLGSKATAQDTPIMVYLILNTKRHSWSAFLVAGAGLEPATFGLCLPPRLSPPELHQFVVRTFPSPSS